VKERRRIFGDLVKLFSHAAGRVSIICAANLDRDALTAASTISQSRTHVAGACAALSILA